MRTSLLLLLLLVSANAASPEERWIRINQLGYLPLSVKAAVLVSRDSGAVAESFDLVDALTGEVRFTSRAIVPYTAWGPFRSAARLDFSSFVREGAYQIRAGDTFSPPFRIGRGVYDGTADFLLRYLRQQRSGFNPFLKDSCHTRDGFIIYHPTLDSAHTDVSGGWHDASDYLQYVTTSATAVAQMLFAYERHPGGFRDSVGSDGLSGANGIPDILDEAKWGLDWLLKMNPAPGMMFNQLADDRDHLGFRLPTEDPVDYGKGKERPVYFCTGKPQGIFGNKNRATGIASTAAKFATAFAMASRILTPHFRSSPLPPYARKALEAFRYGEEHPGVCQTAPCRSPYFYEEDNWVDDVELAATQLALLFPDSSFVREAASYGIQEPVTPWMGEERARHYQWYPFVNLGHYYLARTTSGDGKRFRGLLGQGLERVWQRGRENPFLIGVPFIWCSNNLVSAALTQARLYRELTGEVRYREMEAALRDWLFGCNPWGTSMIIGLPRYGISPRDPHSAFTHLHGYPIDGGLVDGPVYASIFSSLKGVTLSKGDAFAPFQSDIAVYHDDWADYSTNEPTMDGTASLTYVLAALEAEGNSGGRRGESLEHGGIVRMDSTRKEIYLAFTGDEFGEGGTTIRRALKAQGAKASFFLTGRFYRNSAFAGLIRDLRKDGHYLGPHSDAHLLYAPWSKRDSLLVAREEFTNDLRANYEAMRAFGIRKEDAQLFLPPYEWYNGSIAAWTADLGLRLVNFTPGTLSNADYTFPGEGRYMTSDSILSRILEVERSASSGLNGHILLMHIGVDPRRPDPLYRRLEELLKGLKKKGYAFRRFR